MASDIRTCTRDQWSVSYTSGNMTLGYVLNVGRHYNNLRNQWGGLGRIKSADSDGLTFDTQDAATRHCLEHGYLQPYGRNLMGFKQSRAARKRGHVCTDWRYNSRAQSYAAVQTA